MSGRGGLLLGAAALFLLLCLVYGLSIGIRASRGASITGDEPFYLLTTQSLIHDGDLDLSHQFRSRSYEVFFDHPSGLWLQSVPTADGRLLSPHNPGLSVLAIPGFALGKLVGVQVQLMVLAAAAFALAFVLADHLTGKRALSWLAALGVGLTAIAFIHSTEIYPEFPAALLLVASLVIAAKAAKITPLESLVLVALLSAMCWLGVKYAPLAVLVAGYLFIRARTAARILLVGLGAASAAVFVWFHLKTFGALTPYHVSSVYWGMNTIETLSHHVGFEERIYRLWGLFIDRRFGIGRWAPLLLVAVPGLLILAKNAGVTQRTIAALIAAQVLVATFLAVTMMGFWFPGRTLVTVLPLFIVPITLVLAASPTWGRMAIGGLAVYAIVITAGLAHAGHTSEVTIAVDPFDMDFPPFKGLSLLFPDYRSWSPHTWVLTVLWLLLGAISLIVAWRPRLYRKLVCNVSAIQQGNMDAVNVGKLRGFSRT